VEKSISYIIAGYNEEAVIEQAVRECHAILSEDFDDFELILVDDASKDHTREIMDRLSLELSCVHVLHNLINLNFGTSVLRGMNFATKDIVIFNAADLPLSPKLTKSIAKEMVDCDLLVLERETYPGAKWRKIASSFNKLFLYILYPGLMRGTPVVNYVQVFRREIIGRILPLARSPIFVWPEMIFRGKRDKTIRVKNKAVPVNISVSEHKRKGAFGKPNDIIWGMYDMFRFRIRSWMKKI